MPQSSRESHEQLLETRTTNVKLRIEEALAIFTIARRRCVEGYLFDCEKNIKILQDDRWLQRLWTWIGRRYAIRRIGLQLIRSRSEEQC